MLKQCTISLSNHADAICFHTIEYALKLKLHNFNINHNMIVLINDA